MHSIILVMKIGVVFGALMGIILLVNQKLNADISFSPAIAASVIICFMFFAGLLNLMPEAVMTLYISGIAYLIKYLWDVLSRKKGLGTLLRPATIFIIVCCALSVLCFKDVIFHIWDEFSHWGTVMKEVVRVQGLPDARTVIDYKEYPPAAAVFGYFFMFATGFSESICYIAQGVLCACMLAVFLYGCSWKNIRQIFVRVAFTAVLLCVSYAVIPSLLVDYLIAFAACALLVILYENRDMAASDMGGLLKMTTPVAIALCLIKTNAVAFYVVYLVFVGWFLYKGAKRRSGHADKLNLKHAICFASPFIVLFMWKKYIDKAYLGEGYDTVKFAVTKENLLKNFYEKPAELIHNIITDLLKTVYTHRETRTILALLAVGLIFVYISNKKGKDSGDTGFVCITGAVVWMLYMAGYGLMLVFLMPKWEFDSYGITMIGYTRYMGAAFGVCAGIMLYVLIRKLETDFTGSGKMTGVTLSAVTVAAIYFFSGSNIFSLYNYQPDPQIVYLYNRTALINSVCQVSGKTGFYIGDYVDDTSAFNNHYFTMVFSNREVYNFGNAFINGQQYTFDDGRLLDNLEETKYIVKMVDDNTLMDIFERNNVQVDYTDGLVYSIETDGECLRAVKVG